MRRRLVMILFISVVFLAAAEQSLRQFQSLKSSAECWAQLGLLSCLQSVYAEERGAAEVAVAETRGGSYAQNDFRWQGRVAPGKVIEIKGVNGNIRAEAASGDAIEVFATKTARRSNPNSVSIQVLEHAEGVTICVMYPSDDSSRPNVCGYGNEGHMNVHNNDVKVDFVVRVPSGVRFTGRTVNGEVEAQSLDGSVEASTVNGSIRISTASYAGASTVNGGINVSMGRANWTQPLEFETVNGSITLTLPAETGTELRAETLNGEISTDFPITVQGRLSKRRMSGTIGSGGRELMLKTVNGDIQVRRAS